MSKYSKNYRQDELKIRRIEATSDRLSGRAGLVLFVAYLHRVEIFGWFDRWFGTIRKNTIQKLYSTAESLRLGWKHFEILKIA
jgi:hypothetical protein